MTVSRPINSPPTASGKQDQYFSDSIPKQNDFLLQTSPTSLLSDSVMSLTSKLQPLTICQTNSETDLSPVLS